MAQLPRAQRRHRAVERLEQARAAFGARPDDFQVRLRHRVEHQKRVRPVATQRRDVLQRPAHLVLEVMENRPRRADPARQVRAAEAVERLHAEMLAQRPFCLLEDERVRVVGLGAAEIRERLRLGRVVAHEKFCRRHPRQLVEQRRARPPTP